VIRQFFCRVERSPRAFIFPRDLLSLSLFPAGRGSRSGALFLSISLRQPFFFRSTLSQLIVFRPVSSMFVAASFWTRGIVRLFSLMFYFLSHNLDSSSSHKGFFFFLSLSFFLLSDHLLAWLANRRGLFFFACRASFGAFFPTGHQSMQFHLEGDCVVTLGLSSPYHVVFFLYRTSPLAAEDRFSVRSPSMCFYLVFGVPPPMTLTFWRSASYWRDRIPTFFPPPISVSRQRRPVAPVRNSRSRSFSSPPLPV